MLTSLYVLHATSSPWTGIQFSRKQIRALVADSSLDVGTGGLVVLAFMLCTHAYSCARARARTNAHVDMRVRVSHIGSFFRCIVSYSGHVSRALYEGQFRGHKRGSLTDDKRHLGSRRIRQDEAVVTVELLDALFLAGEWTVVLGTSRSYALGKKIFRLFNVKKIKNISFGQIYIYISFSRSSFINHWKRRT